MKDAKKGLPIVHIPWILTQKEAKKLTALFNSWGIHIEYIYRIGEYTEIGIDNASIPKPTAKCKDGS